MEQAARRQHGVAFFWYFNFRDLPRKEHPRRQPRAKSFLPGKSGPSDRPGQPGLGSPRELQGLSLRDGSKLEVFEREALVDQLLERVEADAQVGVHEGGIHLGVAFGGFDAVRQHGLIADQQKRPGGDFVEESCHENRGGFHVDGQCADFSEVDFEIRVMLPDPAVGCVNSAGPVIALRFADGRGDGFLQGKGGQRGHLGGEVVVAGAFTPDGRDGQDEVADGCAVLEPAALAEEQHGLRVDRCQQVHDRGRGGAAHAEVDDADASGRGAGHRFVAPPHFDPVPLGEELHVVGKISQEDVVAELFQLHTRVAGEPVSHDFCAGFQAS
jgi:hypothetical protein